MAQFSSSELKVYGTCETGDDIPITSLPILISRNGLQVILDYEIKDSQVIVDGRWLETLEEFEQGLEVENEREGTVFTPVVTDLPVDDDHCLFLHGKTIEYVTYTEALRRLNAFADLHRQAGDDAYRRGEIEEAREAWAKAASASQTAVDFARLLLVEDNDGIKETWRRYLRKLNTDPETLPEQIRAEIMSQTS